MVKKLYFKLTTLTAIVAIVFTGLFVGVFFGIKGIYNSHFQKGYVYQYRALQNAEKNKPKIIVVGGSYMTFAVNSRKLSEYTGMPVYTLGIHSGMGMSYVFETAKEFINKNDIIIFPFSDYTPKEYGMGLIYISLDGESDMFWQFFKSHPFEILKTAGSEICDKLWGVLSYFKWKGKKTEGVYYASSFDKSTGNIIYKREKPILLKDVIEKTTRYDIKKISPGVFDEINKFDVYCKEKGAKFYLTFAPILKDCVVDTNKELIDYEAALSKKLDAPFISKIEDCLLPYDLMFDSTMHLNDKGADYYSKKLADDLMRARKKDK